FLRGCSESSAFARCAAGALELAAFCRVSANALVRKEPPKRSCAPDAAHSPLAMRAPGDCNPRPRHHDLQLRSRPIASEACAPRVGKTASFEPRASSHTVTSERGLTESGGTPACGGFSLRPNGARRGGSQYGPPSCISAQPLLQTSRPVGFRRAAARKEMGTFLISPLRGQKGTDLLQVCPLLLGNEECPHYRFRWKR